MALFCIKHLNFSGSTCLWELWAFKNASEASWLWNDWKRAFFSVMLGKQVFIFLLMIQQGKDLCLICPEKAPAVSDLLTHDARNNFLSPSSLTSRNNCTSRALQTAPGQKGVEKSGVHSYYKICRLHVGNAVTMLENEVTIWALIPKIHRNFFVTFRIVFTP